MSVVYQRALVCHYCVKGGDNVIEEQYKASPYPPPPPPQPSATWQYVASLQPPLSLPPGQSTLSVRGNLSARQYVPTLSAALLSNWSVLFNQVLPNSGYLSAGELPCLHIYAGPHSFSPRPGSSAPFLGQGQASKLPRQISSSHETT